MDASSFRDRVRALVRALGVLQDDRTPCGAALSVREAYALEAIFAAQQRHAPLSQSDLQAAVGIDKSNVTRLVQQLVGDGHIEQHAAEADARVRLLYLTGKGRRVVRTVERQSLRRFAQVMARIPAAERASVMHALEVLRAALASDSQGTDS